MEAETAFRQIIPQIQYHSFHAGPAIPHQVLAQSLVSFAACLDGPLLGALDLPIAASKIRRITAHSNSGVEQAQPLLD